MSKIEFNGRRATPLELVLGISAGLSVPTAVLAEVAKQMGDEGVIPYVKERNTKASTTRFRRMDSPEVIDISHQEAQRFNDANEQAKFEEMIGSDCIHAGQNVEMPKPGHSTSSFIAEYEDSCVVAINELDQSGNPFGQGLTGQGLNINRIESRLVGTFQKPALEDSRPVIEMAQGLEAGFLFDHRVEPEGNSIQFLFRDKAFENTGQHYMVMELDVATGELSELFSIDDRHLETIDSEGIVWIDPFYLHDAELNFIPQPESASAVGEAIMFSLAIFLILLLRRLRLMSDD